MPESQESERSGAPQMECDLPLGRPGLVVHDELVLSGWAAGRSGVTGVAVNVDERVWTAGYGIDTPWLAKRLPGIEGAERAGYRLAIDTSRWAPGPRYVAVSAYDPSGRRTVIEGPIDVRPLATPVPESPNDQAGLEHREVTLHVDSPTIHNGKAEIAGALEVRGWAHAKEGIDAVLVTLDGTIQYEALRPISRPDLLTALGPVVADDAGFSLTIDPSECPPGSHSLTIVALGREGHSMGVACELECRPPEPKTISSLPVSAAAPDGSEGVPEDRVLLAEADAALSRAEARFAGIGQERARRELREAEEEAGAFVERLRSQLMTARGSLITMREEKERELSTLEKDLHLVRDEMKGLEIRLNESRYELEGTAAQLAESRGEQHRIAAAMDSVERSASWKMTRPFRAVKRLLHRVLRKSTVASVVLALGLSTFLAACGGGQESGPPGSADAKSGKTGTVPFQLTADGEALSGPGNRQFQIQPSAITGYVDNVIPEGKAINLTGWAAKGSLSGPAELIVGMVDGRGTAQTEPANERPDVAQSYGSQALKQSGFTLFVETAALNCDEPEGGLTVFGLAAKSAAPLTLVGNSKDQLDSVC